MSEIQRGYLALIAISWLIAGEYAPMSVFWLALIYGYSDFIQHRDVLVTRRVRTINS